MSGKFMKVKRIAVSTLTMLMIASQLTGCAGVTQQEAADMVDRNETIEIEVAVPDNIDDIQVEWVELGKLNTYPEFRAKFDEIFGILDNGQSGKTGCIYYDMNNKPTNNSTLRYAFNNPLFIKIMTSHEESINKIIVAAKETFIDIESDKEALLAAIDAYFGLFSNGDGNYFNGNQTLTRAEFLTGVYKANSPVKTLETNININYDSMSPFVNQMLGYSYFNLQDGSMNEDNYNSAMTRAEAIYTLMNMFYSDQITAVGDNFEVSFIDAKNSGYNTDTNKDKSAILNQALQNPDNGMPGHLYRALAVAEANDIVSGVESRWDEAITKSEAMEMIFRIYLDKETWTENQEAITEDEATNDKQQESVDVSNLMILVTEDGRIACSQELADSVKNSVKSAGLSDTLSGQVLSNYAEITKSMDNSVIHQDVIDNIIESFKKTIETQNKVQEEQREQAKKEQQAQQNQNNNQGNSGNKNEQSAGADFETPENNNSTNDGPLPGETTIDITPGKGGDGGELISDGKLNSN